MAYGMDDRTNPSVIGWARIATGLAQGVALWALTEIIDGKAGFTANHVLLGAIEAVAMFAPFVVLGGLADMRRRTLVLWGVAAAIALAALGAHDIGRRVVEKGPQWLAPETMAFLAAGLFIAHHLVAGADADRKLIARFATYFDLAWKHGVQLAMSAGFVGVFWIVLFLGGALFKLIGITLIADIIEKPWFALPATGTMFAIAVQLTDVRHGLIRGIRTMALTLLSWLLPVLVLLAGAFMASLPFTGLEPLWKTKSAAAILLSAAAVMIILINAAYQDGEPDEATPLVLRWAARIGGLLLVPLVAVAGYAVWLRIGQYGLTPDRIIATACVIAGVCYAVGYSVAAVLPGAWMKLLELTNIVTAIVVVGLILALFSPLADPARLSVGDQMARLADGRLKPEKVDYLFLRFHAERYGVAALKTLTAKGGDAGRRAAEALAWRDERSANPETPAVKPGALEAAIRPSPKEDALPADFWAMGAEDRDDLEMVCVRTGPDENEPCEAVQIDLNSDGLREIVVTTVRDTYVFARKADGKWAIRGELVGCEVRKNLRAGRYKLLPSPAWRSLEMDGHRVVLVENYETCSGDLAESVR